jgi:hypothetical protein
MSRAITSISATLDNGQPEKWAAPARFAHSGRTERLSKLENKLLRGPDSAELKRDLEKVERRLRHLGADDTFSAAERKIEKQYFNHWRKRLEYLLRKEGVQFKEARQDGKEAEQTSSGHIKASDESWKVITPHPLLRAVSNIRDDFGRSCDQQRDFLRDKCFKELHELSVGTTEPLVFKNYFFGCIERIRQIVASGFGRFLEISLNQNGLIGAASVHWASLQTTDLIECEDRLVEDWIKSVCDKRSEWPVGNSQEFVEKVVFRTDWRAPRWLIMQPNGNAVYDPSAAWKRMNETDTKELLRYLREDRWILLLESKVSDVAGIAYESHAKRGTSAQNKQPRLSAKPEGGTSLSAHQPLMLKYRSGIKRAILGALTKKPIATDAEVCRILDEDGGEDLPQGWKNRKEDRLFFDAYRNPRTKRKVEIAISKIRRDLRDRGLLH